MAELHALVDAGDGAAVRRFLEEQRKQGSEAAVAQLLSADVNGLNALQKAVLTGRYAVVQALLEAGANVEQSAAVAKTPLLLACEAGLHTIARLLLSHGASMAETGEGTQRPIQAASLQGHVMVVRELLMHAKMQEGASESKTQSTQAPSKGGDSAKGKDEALDANLNSNLDEDGDNEQENDDGEQDAAAVAAEPGAEGSAEVETEVPQTAKQWATEALPFACLRNQIEVARCCIKEFGADPNGCIAGKITALHACAYGGSRELCNFLLQHGADPNSADSSGAPPLTEASRHSFDVFQAMLDGGADPNVTAKDGTSLLMHCATLQDERFAAELLRRGANVSTTNARGENVLHFFAGRLPRELELVLREAPDVDVNVASNSGFTPLHFAANMAESESVRLLLEHGADPDKADEEGKTPLYGAVRAGFFHCCLFLLEYGASVEKAKWLKEGSKKKKNGEGADASAADGDERQEEEEKEEKEQGEDDVVDMLGQPKPNAKDGAIAALLERVAWVPWTKQLHHVFPRAVRLAIVETLKCWRRKSCTLSVVPRDILMHICSYVATRNNAQGENVWKKGASEYADWDYSRELLQLIFERYTLAALEPPLREAIEKGQCTKLVTQNTFLPQPWYTCETCKMGFRYGNSLGCCQTCIKVCHAGHEYRALALARAFCDCAQSVQCQLYDKLTILKQPTEVVNAEGKKETYMFLVAIAEVTEPPPGYSALNFLRMHPGDLVRAKEGQVPTQEQPFWEGESHGVTGFFVASEQVMRPLGDFVLGIADVEPKAHERGRLAFKDKDFILVTGREPERKDGSLAWHGKRIVGQPPFEEGWFLGATVALPELYEKAHDHKPKVNQLLSIAVALKESGNLEEAGRVLRSAITLILEFAPAGSISFGFTGVLLLARLELTMALMAQGRKKESYDEMKLCLADWEKERPHTREQFAQEVLFVFTDICFALRKYDEAERTLARINLTDVGSLEQLAYHSKRCSLYLSMGDLEQSDVAIDEYKATIERLGISGNHANYWEMKECRIMWLHLAGRLEEALQRQIEVMKEHAEDGNATDACDLAYRCCLLAMELGKYEQAKSIAEAGRKLMIGAIAASDQPDEFPFVKVMLAMEAGAIETRLGNFEAARAKWEALLLLVRSFGLYESSGVDFRAGYASMCVRPVRDTAFQVEVSGDGFWMGKGVEPGAMCKVRAVWLNELDAGAETVFETSCAFPAAATPEWESLRCSFEVELPEARPAVLEVAIWNGESSAKPLETLHYYLATEETLAEWTPTLIAPDADVLKRGVDSVVRAGVNGEQQLTEEKDTVILVAAAVGAAAVVGMAAYWLLFREESSSSG